MDLGIDGAFVKHPDLAWIARNAGKPGRPSQESWVLHATSAWSTNHLEDSPEVVFETLLSAFFESTGATPVQTYHTDAHRWRYVPALNPLQDECLWDASIRLAVCGDWCYASRVEGAFLIDMAAAERIMGMSDKVGTTTA